MQFTKNTLKCKGKGLSETVAVAVSDVKAHVYTDVLFKM